MATLQALPDREVGERLEEMRGVVRGLPAEVDGQLLPYAIRGRNRIDDFPQFVEGDFAWRAIDASGLYMIVLGEILERPLAPWVLGRASLEASARAAWVSDTTLTATQRLERNLSLQLDDMPDVKDEQDAHGLGDTIRTTLLSVAEQGGVDLSLDGFRKIIPRKKRMVEEALGMGLWYGDFSSIVHNNSYANRAVGLAVEPSLDPRANTLLPVVTWAYSVAVWRFFKAHDLPCDQLEGSLSRAGQVMTFPDSFWEQRPQPQL